MTEQEAVAKIAELMRTTVPAPPSGPTHIRKRAGKSLARQGYSHNHAAMFAGGYKDPMSETLCGAEATTHDLSWAETRHARNRAYVSCEACITNRTAAI